MAQENKHTTERDAMNQERAGAIAGGVARVAWPLANCAVWLYAIYSLCNACDVSHGARTWVLLAFLVVWHAVRGFFAAAREARR